MKKEQVTYDKFLQVANIMLGSGEKLTVRAILSRTGGSFGKISEFLKRFEQERAYLNFAKQGDISDSLRQAMFSEIAKAVSDAKTALESQINQLTTHLDEANEQLTDQEKHITSLREENSTLKEKLMLAQQSMHDLESANKELKEKADNIQKEKVLAITDAAKSKLQLERSDGDIKEMKEKIKTMQTYIDEVTQAKYAAEKCAAVAEARFDQILKNDKHKN